MDDRDNRQSSEDLEQPVFCQVCSVSLTGYSPAGRQAHYERHFEETPDWALAGPSRPSRTNFAGARTSPKKMGNTKAPIPQDKQNIFWNRSQDAPPPKNFTPGIIPVLKRALLKSHAKGQTVRAALCYEGMVHVATEMWDMGWGCGYRNFLMACTALIDQQVQPMYFPALDQPTSPGVRNLQQWIEDAWNAGFDEEGAVDLKGKLVGTKKWIGTAELYVAFLSRGIPSRLVDFPSVTSGADAVLQWVERYFTSPLASSTQATRAGVKTSVNEALHRASPVVVTDRMPLVLQHQGHSRTIVGYERLKTGYINLLCFDPSRRPSAQVREAAIAESSSARTHLSSVAPVLEKHSDISPSKILNRLFHPRHHDGVSSGVKRHPEKEENVRSTKRVRGGLKAPDISKEVIVIHSDDDNDDDDSKLAGPNSTDQKTLQRHSIDIDYGKTLESFRLKPKKVSKNDRYQILYFPLEDLLSEQERWAKRVVTSEVIR
ncbi:hypothetical protein M0805_008935 [Coniferiporia weirii]|nr:hypothetical protein M0805_008935 [Coniferiporia weirii]